MFVHCSYELCACTASHAARLALVHGSFTPKTLDFLEMRYLNDRCPVVDCDKVTVTNGLFILLQATGHGLDPLRGVSDVDICNWPEDHARLRRAVTETKKSFGIGGSSFRKRLVSCPDSFLNELV